MVGKNNHQVRKQRAVKQVPRYGLRKLRGGAYSVLLGTLLVVGTPVVAHAANEGSVNADQPKTTIPAPAADSVGKTVTLPAATPAPTTTTKSATLTSPEPTTSDKTTPVAPVSLDKIAPAPAPADQAPAPATSSSAATTALGPATLTDMATRTNQATLIHNDHSDRSLQVTVPVVNGDQVTVTVPAIFVATETGGGKHATATVSHAPATVDYETTKPSPTRRPPLPTR